jgi:hypothetical protein
MVIGLSREVDMTREILISRRTAFSLLGVALPATIMTVSQGVAQTPAEERREERREEREERREQQREERREEQREEPRARSTIDEPTTTGTAPAVEEGRVYRGGPKQDD